MNRSVEWTRPALKDLRSMDSGMVDRVLEAVTRLAATEQGDVVRLTNVRPTTFRLRVGDWRVLFAFDGPPGVVRVLRVLPRGEAYR